MEQAAVALQAIGESIVFLDHFKGLPDPRQRGQAEVAAMTDERDGLAVKSGAAARGRVQGKARSA
jgi:hypothetical protein